MKMLLVSVIALAAAASQASFAQTLTPEQLAQRAIERRAVEAAIWGMPVVNYDLMLQEMLTKTAGKVNQMIYWGRPLDWRNQTLTPNPDTLYFIAFFNTRDVGPIVIDIPAASGLALATTSLGPPAFCAPMGIIDINLFDLLLNNNVLPALAARGVNHGTFPIFFLHNVVMSDGDPTNLNNCCILGYHSTNNAGTQAYAVAAYSDPGIFSKPGIRDIHALSHEVGEWMDDPLIPSVNIVPAWGHVGQVSGCQNNLENGDPVTGSDFTVAMGGTFPFTYHPEDLVFLPWFARVSPSTSVNGWYTFLNAFAAPQAVCH